MPVVNEFSGCILGRGAPWQGRAWAQAHRGRAQGSLVQTQCTLIGLWSHWILNRASSPRTRAGQCAKKCSPNGCVGFWGPQLCSPGCTGDIIDTRWDQPLAPTMCHTTGISLNISSLTRTSLLIPGWSKPKICSYSFYDIYKSTLPLGKRLEKHSEMQRFTHKFILDNLARITVLKSQKSPWITGILIIEI